MRIPAFLSAMALLLLLAACGADPTPPADSTAPADPADTSDTASESVPTDTEPAEEIPAYQQSVSFTTADGKYRIDISAPTVVVQADPKVQTWGHYQFPHLARTAEGFIICSYSVTGTDTIEYTGTSGQKISVNGGKSWMIPTALDSASPMSEDRLMANGKYFNGFGGAGAHTVSYMNNYTPELSFNSYNMFFWEDLKDDPDAKLDTELYCNVYDPETKTTEKIEVTLNWPYAAVTQHPGKLAYPIKQVFSLCGRSNRVIDGIPYVFLYTRSFDAFADSREEAVDTYSQYSGVYVLNSPDYGKTWNLISQIRVDDNILALSNDDGLYEPMVTVAPDGTWVMLMRSGSVSPSFISYSKDKGYTWSYPEVFDECGVLPQIITLDCGVTLATYGRPYMYFRATNDPSALTWDEHFNIPLSVTPTKENYMKVSCFNNSLVALSEDTAIMAYTDFRYPNKDGARTKTVLTRTVKVVMLDE